MSKRKRLMHPHFLKKGTKFRKNTNTVAVFVIIETNINISSYGVNGMFCETDFIIGEVIIPGEGLILRIRKIFKGSEFNDFVLIREDTEKERLKNNFKDYFIENL